MSSSAFNSSAYISFPQSFSAKKISLSTQEVIGKPSMDERHNNLNKQRSNMRKLLRDGDFEEAEIWDFVSETKDYYYPPTSKSTNNSNEIITSVPRKLHTAAIMIPRRSSSSIGITRGGSGIGGSSSSGNSIDELNPIRLRSAPVAKMYVKKSKNVVNSQRNCEDDEEEEEEEEGGRWAPHELIAKRVSKSRISSFSVFEGVGRTLKGRDLCKVRNAVLTKTGFLE